MASNNAKTRFARETGNQGSGRRGVVHVHPAYREASGRSVGIDLVSQSRIGIGLRGMYDELLNQPVPEHLADLIRRMT